MEALRILTLDDSPTPASVLRSTPPGMALGTSTPSAPTEQATFTPLRRSGLTKKKGLFVHSAVPRTAPIAPSKTARSSTPSTTTQTSRPTHPDNPFYLSTNKKKKKGKKEEDKESDIPIVMLDNLFDASPQVSPAPEPTTSDPPTQGKEREDEQDEQPASEVGATVITSKRKSKAHKHKSKKTGN